MAVKFQQELPREVPSSLPVYQLQRPNATRAQLTEIAKRIAPSENGEQEFKDAGSWLAYRDGLHEFEVNKRSGALGFRHLEKYGVELETPFELRDQEAVRIATQLAESARLVPMKEARMERVTHLHAALARMDDGGQPEETILDAGVLFRRTINDVAVTGPGGALMVHIGPEREVVGARRIWRELGKQAGRVRIRPPEYAIQRLERLLRAVEGEVIVTKAEFGYFEQGPLDGQTTLQPAYAFVYEVQGDFTYKSAEAFPAGEKSFGALKGKKRFPSKQETRG
jgi:hypothetical protein